MLSLTPCTVGWSVEGECRGDISGIVRVIFRVIFLISDSSPARFGFLLPGIIRLAGYG